MDAANLYSLLKTHIRILIKGLAGCIKSSLLIEFVKYIIKKDEKTELLILSRNRNLRKKYLQAINLSKNNIHTCHSLGYKIGFINNVLPENFKSTIINDYCKRKSSNGRKLKKSDYDKLLYIAEEYLSKTEPYNNLDYIVIDEYQDLPLRLVNLIKIIVKVNPNARLICTGDDRQIIDYTNKRNNLKQFKKDFGDYKEIILKKNYRSSDSILKFINGFYRIVYLNENLYYDVDKEKKNTDVFIHLEQDQEMVRKKVDKVIEKYQGKKIMILSLTKRMQKIYEAIYKHNSNITVTTIHKSRSLDADIVIIDHTLFHDRIKNRIDMNVWNVAITRAKEKLHIISSFPKRKVTRFFTLGTYVLENNQVKRYNRNNIWKAPDISPLGIDELKLENVRRSFIDSIAFQFKYEELPFIPYELQSIKKYCEYRKSKKLKLKNLTFFIHRNNGNITFSFLDLNPLKGLRMTDEEILNYVLEIIQEYFDYRISLSTILNGHIKELHLADYIYSDNPEKSFWKFNALFKMSTTGRAESVIISKVFNTSNMYLYLNPNGKLMKKAMDYMYKTGEQMDPFRYEREIKKEKNYRNIVIYSPVFKKRNKIVDAHNYLKVEVRRKNKYRGDPSKYALNMNIKELMKVIKERKIKDLYYTWIRDEFSFIGMKAPKNIELLKKNRGITHFGNVLNYFMRKGNKKKENNKIYHIFLSLLNDSDRKMIKKFFGDITAVQLENINDSINVPKMNIYITANPINLPFSINSHNISKNHRRRNKEFVNAAYYSGFT